MTTWKIIRPSEIVIMGPLIARGVIKRRRSMTNLVQAMDADRRAVQRMQALRDRYGPGPVQLQIPGRDIALVLDPEDVDRILAETPEPFAAQPWR